MQKAYVIVAGALLALVCSVAPAEEITLGTGSDDEVALDPTTYLQQISYVLGQNIAHDLMGNGIEFDIESLTAGVSDVVNKRESKWSDEELSRAMAIFEQQLTQQMVQQFQRQAEKNKQAGDAFLAANKQREGVQVTPSGLQYIVLKEGTGPSPTIDDTVKCHYRGSLIDGTQFESSYEDGDEPVPFKINGNPPIIPAWVEALQKMRVGSKWQIFVPSELGFGLDPPGAPIEPNSALVFEIELVEIVDE